jgi:sigma-B regulation protein RsbU (phosphoserine phosphatase)
VNLPDLLSTVFSATARDRDEVPFAVDSDGHLYTPTPEDRRKIEALGSGFLRPDAKPGTTRLPEWIVVTTRDPTGSGLRFGIARPVGDALSELRTTAARTAGLGLLFIVVTLIGVVPLSVGLTRSLSRLNEGVRRIAAGDYAARVPVKTQDEIGKLARAFNQMAQDVEKHERVALEQERFKRELELGRQIQHDMLPHAPLRVGRTELRGISVAAGEVGGDFFNYLETGTGQVALLIGDVAGKGVGAALLMANIQASLRVRLALRQELTALAEEIDRQIQADTPEPVYATLFVAILEPATRVLRYVNAGHNPPYILHKDGGFERLEASGLPVGLLAGRGYTEQQVQLVPDDVVFCYTDGCVEAESETGEMFGADALERALVDAGTLSADALLRRMEETLRTFRGAREPSDDATMMVVTVG